MTAVEVIPHSSAGIVASVVIARSSITFITIPEMAVRVGRAQCMWARKEAIAMSAAQMLNNMAKVF